MPTAPAKPRKPWIWLSAVLALVAAGLLIWALTLRSDVDSTQQELAAATEELEATKQQLDAADQEVEALQAEGDEGVKAGAVVVGGAALYDQFAEQLGAKENDLAATQQKLEDAEKAAAQAEKDAKAAKQNAADAADETERAQAQADEAKAEAEAAEARATIVTECAKASIAALGPLFEGESTDDEAAAAQEQLSELAATCKQELAGT